MIRMVVAFLVLRPHLSLVYHLLGGVALDLLGFHALWAFSFEHFPVVGPNVAVFCARRSFFSWADLYAATRSPHLNLKHLFMF